MTIPAVIEPAAPAPEPTNEPVAAAPAPEVAPLVEASKRQQTSRAIGVSISAARTRRHIDRLNLNNKLDSMISEVRSERLGKTRFDFNRHEDLH